VYTQVDVKGQGLGSEDAGPLRKYTERWRAEGAIVVVHRVRLASVACRGFAIL
jgi:hypothetical protein